MPIWMIVLTIIINTGVLLCFIGCVTYCILCKTRGVDDESVITTAPITEKV